MENSTLGKKRSEIYNKDDIEEAVEVTEDEDDGNPFE